MGKNLSHFELFEIFRAKMIPIALNTLVVIKIKDETFSRHFCPLCNVSSNSYCMQNFFPRFSQESVNKVT